MTHFFPRFEQFKNNIAKPKLIKIKIAKKFNIFLLNLHLINERSCIFCAKLQIIASLIQLAYLLTGFSNTIYTNNGIVPAIVQKNTYTVFALFSKRSIVSFLS